MTGRGQSWPVLVRRRIDASINWRDGVLNLLDLFSETAMLISLVDTRIRRRQNLLPDRFGECGMTWLNLWDIEPHRLPFCSKMVLVTLPQWPSDRRSLPERIPPAPEVSGKLGLLTIAWNRSSAAPRHAGNRT